MRRAMSLGAVLAMVIGMVGGCADIGQDPSDPASLPQGLTVIESTDIAISVAYKRDNIVIYMQALRGLPTSEPYASTPNSPRHEIDARIMADNGRIFWVQRGGDLWVDPLWADDLERQEDLPPMNVSTRLLFDMAAEAVVEMNQVVGTQIGVARAQSLAPELKALRQMGMQARTVYAQLKERNAARIRAAGVDTQNEIPYGAAGPEPADFDASVGYWNIDMHNATLVWPTWHTATRLQKWNGSSWAFAFDACNHGRCPFIDGMYHDCYVQYHAAVVDYKPTWKYWACNTPYDLVSGGGGHNCHDDTRLQMASFVYGNGHQQDPGNKYWCDGGPAVLVGTPECNSNTGDGWNHPDMCRERNRHGWNEFAGCYCDQDCLTYNDCCLDGPW